MWLGWGKYRHKTVPILSNFNKSFHSRKHSTYQGYSYKISKNLWISIHPNRGPRPSWGETITGVRRFGRRDACCAAGDFSEKMTFKLLFPSPWFLCETCFRDISWQLPSKLGPVTELLRGSWTPTAHQCLRCSHPHILFLFCPIMLNHSTCSKPIFWACFVASGLLNSYTKFHSDWTITISPYLG